VVRGIPMTDAADPRALVGADDIEALKKLVDLASGVRGAT